MSEQSSPTLKRSVSQMEQGYTFSRSKRFTTITKSPEFYNIPRALNKRGTIFGSEKRSSLFPESNSPGPSHYNPNHSLSNLGKIINDSNVGYRLKYPKNASPGPGSYIINRNLDGPKFSIKGRHKKTEPPVSPSGATYNPNFSMVLTSKYSQISFGYGKKTDPSKGKIFPGPGSYSVPAIFPKINLSKTISSKEVVMKKSSMPGRSLLKSNHLIK